MYRGIRLGSEYKYPMAIIMLSRLHRVWGLGLKG